MAADPTNNNRRRPPKGPPSLTEERGRPSEDRKLSSSGDTRRTEDRLLPTDRRLAADRRPLEDKKLPSGQGPPKVAKFPVTTRESVYDNVKDVSDNEDDEGIDNDYSDDSGTPPKVGGGDI